MPPALTVLTADYCQRQCWSGIGVAAAVQANALARQGCPVDVLSPAIEAGVSIAANPRLHALSRERFPCAPPPGTLLHLHSLGLAELALELVRRFRLRLVYTVHALPHRELSDSLHTHSWAHSWARSWTAVQERLFSAAACVIFLNHADQAEAVRRNAGLRARSHVLPNPIPRTEPPADDQREHLALFAGRFAASKGIALLAATIAGLLDRACSWSFAIAGGHGDAAGHEIVARLAARYPERCRMPGWLDRPAINALYARASLVLIPSLYEPCGMVALEAMRMGAPVLASNADGLARLGHPESGAVLVEDRSPQSWIATSERLMADHELRHTLSRRGPAYVAAHCDPQRWAGQFLAATEG